MNVSQRLNRTGILPVITVKDPADAVPLAKALVAGGLSNGEFTFRTDAAEAAIKAVSKEVPEMLLGAGTVMTIEQVDRAIDAGAKFIVAPGINPEIVKHCQSKEIPVFPGIATASEMDLAVRLGLSVVKFFPAEANGGITAIKALSAPFPSMRFVPTGGVNAKNLNDYLAFPRIFSCGGSWMVDQKLIDQKDFDGIRRMTKQAVDTMLDFRFAHLGVNCEDPKAAEQTARFFCDTFAFDFDEHGDVSIFCGRPLEIMKHNGKGVSGHIGFSTISVERAIFHLEARGYRFDNQTTRINKDGERTFIYFADEIAGFAIHLVER